VAAHSVQLAEKAFKTGKQLTVNGERENQVQGRDFSPFGIRNDSRSKMTMADGGKPQAAPLAPLQMISFIR